jgi:hypothetical protein
LPKSGRRLKGGCFGPLLQSPSPGTALLGISSIAFVSVCKTSLVKLNLLPSDLFCQVLFGAASSKKTCHLLQHKNCAQSWRPGAWDNGVPVMRDFVRLSKAAVPGAISLVNEEAANDTGLEMFDGIF